MTDRKQYKPGTIKSEGHPDANLVRLNGHEYIVLDWKQYNVLLDKMWQLEEHNHELQNENARFRFQITGGKE